MFIFDSLLGTFNTKSCPSKTSDLLAVTNGSPFAAYSLDFSELDTKTSFRKAANTSIPISHISYISSNSFPLFTPSKIQYFCN